MAVKWPLSNLAESGATTDHSVQRCRKSSLGIGFRISREIGRSAERVALRMRTDDSRDSAAMRERATEVDWPLPGGNSRDLFFYRMPMVTHRR